MKYFNEFNLFDLVCWNGIICYYYVIKPFNTESEIIRKAYPEEVQRYINLNF